MTDPVHAHYTAAAARLAEVPIEQAGLSCGNPLGPAELRPGEVVLDLGSGAGRDVLTAARQVGPTGRVIGLDLTEGMLALARRHAAEQGVANAEFREGRMEDIPLPDASVDVVLSNCVITLSPDKPRVFAEIARVLRTGGRLAISDVLAEPDLTEAERAANPDRIECRTGALTVDQYAAALAAAGLTEVSIERGGASEDKLFAATIQALRPARGRGR